MNERIIFVEVDLEVIVESPHFTGYLEPSIDSFVSKETSDLFGGLYDV